MQKAKKVYGKSKVLDRNKESVLRDLKRVAKGEITVEDVALKYNVSRATLFNWMKKHRISIKEITYKLKVEMERKLERKVKRKDLMLVPVEDFNDFCEINCIKRIYEELKASGRSETYINDTIRRIYYMCIGKIDNSRIYEPIHPIVLLKSIGEDNDYVRTFLAKVREKYSERTVEAYKSAIRTMVNILGGKKPLYLELHEYEGKFRHIIIPLTERQKLVKMIKENEGKNAEWIIACLKFLYDTGSRAEALTNAVLIRENHSYLSLIHI